MATMTEVKSRRIKNEHDVQVTHSTVLLEESITATLLFSISMFIFGMIIMNIFHKRKPYENV